MQPLSEEQGVRSSGRAHLERRRQGDSGGAEAAGPPDLRLTQVVAAARARPHHPILGELCQSKARSQMSQTLPTLRT